MTLLAALSILIVQEKPVAKWGKIEKGTRFSMCWDFSLKHAGETGGHPILRAETRIVEADLVADEEINGEGTLRVDLKTVTWTYANPDFEVKLTRDEKGQIKDAVKVTAPKDEAVDAEKRAHAFVEELKADLKVSYGYPVNSNPFGYNWSAGDVINGLFDWMMMHDNLGKDGRAAGDAWEEEPDIIDNAGGDARMLWGDKQKTKLTASAAGKGVKVNGTLSWSIKDPDGLFGLETAKHALKKEYTFADGYLTSAKRTISHSYQLNSKEASWKESSTFNVQESLTIKKK